MRLRTSLSFVTWKRIRVATITKQRGWKHWSKLDTLKPFDAWRLVQEVKRLRKEIRHANDG